MAAPLVCPGCGTGGGHERAVLPALRLALRARARGRRPRVAARGRARACGRARSIRPTPRASRCASRRAQNQPEAELVQGLLLEAGIPSLARRSGGFDVPDFLAAGPRDVLVPRGGEAAARELLGHARRRLRSARTPAPAWVRMLALALAALVIALVLPGWSPRS